jgi:hypothetical protein
MSDQKNIEQAQTAVRDMLAALEVARVVCVDDTYADEPSVEEVVVAACSLDQDALKEAFPEIGDSVPEDQDVLKEKIRHLWDELDKAILLKRTKNILTTERVRGDEEIDDFGDASILSEIIPSDMLLELSPEQWEEQRDQLLDEDAEQHTLFLFDQDLSGADGDVEGGIKIISSILAQDETSNLICGLLTHTTKPDEQLKKWEELSTAHNIPRDRFLVVPKIYLSKDPVLFAHTLKLIALSPNFTELKNKVIKIIKSATSKADKRVDAINIYDLEHIVFRVSGEEGLWEPDMLFRLYGLYHRLESRRLAYRGGQLEKIAKRLRHVSHIPTDTAFKPPSSTWKIQQEELYESGEHLNKYHLPLELGDIFAKTGKDSNKHYILLAQPCDLMVRKNGKRQPDIQYVPLAEVVPLPPEKDLPPYSEDMLCFGSGPDEHWFVKLKIIHLVRVYLLDLCVFRDDGAAIIWPGKVAPDGVRPAWQNRYKILSKSFGRIIKQLDLTSSVTGEPPATKGIKSSLKADLLNEGFVKGQLLKRRDDIGITYNFQRVSRLSRDRAFGLLMAYTSVLGRPAYELEFA